jgi:hypothetical protein
VVTRATNGRNTGIVKRRCARECRRWCKLFERPLCWGGGQNAFSLGLYMTGKWPANEIDHRNCVCWDDRFENLRRRRILRIFLIREDPRKNSSSIPSTARRHLDGKGDETPMAGQCDKEGKSRRLPDRRRVNVRALHYTETNCGKTRELSPLKHFCCNDCSVLGTIESLHCGDGVIDDAGIHGRDYRGNAAVNADRSLDGLARSLAT